jgi:hypothetical protein
LSRGFNFISQRNAGHRKPAVSTISNAITTAANTINKDNYKISLLLGHRDALRKLALQIQPTNCAACPPRANEKERSILRGIARENPENLEADLRRSPFFTPLMHLEDRFLPQIHGYVFKLYGLDSDDDCPISILETDAVYFYTGAQVTNIADSLLNPAFRNYLQPHPDNVPYCVGDGPQFRIQVDATIRLFQCDLAMSFIAHVVSREAIPNSTECILLGQHTFINRLRFECIPRAFPQCSPPG